VIDKMEKTWARAASAQRDTWSREPAESSSDSNRERPEHGAKTTQQHL